jgi:ABC-2 type transport system ATP-binding protein
MGLSEWADKKIETLSKGMAQKIQFIATVLTRPRLIVLDEPFSGLDPVNLETIRAAILDLQRQGSTIIFSTHDMAMAEKLCDSIFMIYKGEKVLDGTLNEIQASYGNDTVRLRVPEGARALEGLPGIERVLDMGKYLEVKLQGDSNKFLASLMQRTHVQLFEEARPSLHDIFTRIANPQEEELPHE